MSVIIPVRELRSGYPVELAWYNDEICIVADSEWSYAPSPMTLPLLDIVQWLTGTGWKESFCQALEAIAEETPEAKAYVERAKEYINEATQ
jgi:hypothetical protein